MIKPKIKMHLLDFKRDTYKDSIDNIDQTKYIDCALGVNPYGFTNMIGTSKKLFTNEIIHAFPEYSKKNIIDFWKEVAELKESNIQFAAGTFGVIERVNKLFVDNKTKVIGYAPQFTEFITDVSCCGGEYDFVSLKPDNNFKFNGDEISAHLSNQHSLLYIDNPNNPTGQVISVSTINQIVKAAENLDIVVLVDESYGDFMELDNSAISLVNKYHNLIVARSFSKGFGLAGLRVGYAVTSELLSKYFSKVIHPFPLSGLDFHIANIALQDKRFINDCKNKINKTKQNIINICTRIKVLETDLSVPIMALGHPDKNVNLYKEFLKRKVLTASGEYFIGLGKNYVRLRVPKESDELIVGIIEDIQTNT